MGTSAALTDYSSVRALRSSGDNVLNGPRIISRSGQGALLVSYLSIVFVCFFFQNEPGLHRIATVCMLIRFEPDLIPTCSDVMET